MAKKEELSVEVITPPSIFVTSQIIAQKLLNADVVKAQIKEFATLCDEITVENEADEKRAEEMLGTLNQLLKKVESVRVREKEPYLKAGKYIDNVMKSITDDADKVVLRGKNKIIVWRDAERKRKAEEQRLLEQKAAEEKANLEQSRDLLAIELQNLYVLEHKAIILCGQVKTIEGLKIWYGQYASPEKCIFQTSIAPSFPEKVEEVKKRMMDLKDAKKYLLEGRSDKTTYADAVEKIIDEWRASSGSTAEIANEAIEEKTTELAVTIHAGKAEVEASKKGMFKWTYELVDFNKVPEEWKIVDYDKVKKFIEENKKTLLDGQEINGLKFKKEEIVRLT